VKKYLIILLILVTAMNIVSKQVPDGKELIDWLATNSGYIEGLASYNETDLVLDGWQKEYIDDPAQLIAALKARQIGSSFAMAAKAIAKSQIYKNWPAVLTSMNLDDAREKIMYAGLIHDSIPAKWKSKLITDNKFELGFSNGSRIITMFKPRGKGPADVYIDEMALMPHADDIYDAALYMISRGGQLSIASTPFGKGGRFYDISSNSSEYPDFKRYQLPWWWSSALCIDVKKAILEAPSMPTPDRVDRFGTQTLKLIFRNNTIEGFMQEMELSFIDEQEAFLSYDLIMRCVDPNPEYLYFNKH